jgi:hypothetical protein
MSFSGRQVDHPVDAETNLSRVKTAQKHRRRSSNSEGIVVDDIRRTGVIDDRSFLTGASIVCRDSVSESRFNKAIIPHIRGDPEAMFARARIASACNDCRHGFSSAWSMIFC